MTTASSPLEASLLATHRQKLEAEKKSLEAELQRIARKDPKGDDYHAIVEQVGRAQDENVSEEEQYEAARSVEQSLEVKLRDVNNALGRIEAGTYGVCVRCGNPIERQRLEALPSARTCRTHASVNVTGP